jgi:hypothetical protein
MAPVPSPEPVPSPKILNPIAPIQNNWGKIEPWVNGYQTFLGALGTVFAFAATIALIVEHKGKLPKWPFTAERWNPKPTAESGKKPEVSDEDIIEDELAVAASGAVKRFVPEDVNLELRKRGTYDSLWFLLTLDAPASDEFDFGDPEVEKFHELLVSLCSDAE